MTTSSQCTMDEWTNGRMNAANAFNNSVHLNHCYIDHSLNIEHCSLFINSGGVT